MPKGYPLTGCKRCDKPLEEAGSLSAIGLCQECGEKARTDNFLAMKTHKGPYFDHWRARCLAAFGVNAVDETPRGG
jgi:predicted amidophosphoribosyltransferase